MKEHELKTLAPFWDAVARGDKTFEARKNDRGFNIDDVLVLRRCHYGEDGETVYDDTVEPLRKRVSYMLVGGPDGNPYGVIEGFVILGLGEPLL